jgi:hypothetical protein
MQRLGVGLILVIAMVSAALTLSSTRVRSQAVSCLVMTASGAVQGVD